MPRASIRRRAAPARRGGSSWQPGPPGSSRPAFLHAGTVLLKRLYVLVFIEHGSRRMHLGGVTANPAGERTVQQARNPRPHPRRAVRGHQIPAPRPRPELHRLVRRRLPGRRHHDRAHRRPGAADERDLRAPRRHPAPRAPGPGADPRRGPPARRPGRIPGALQHGVAAPGHRPARPRRRTRRGPHHHYRPRPRTDPPKTRPGRPDQRIRARRLTPRRTAGHQADPIFERDRIRTVLCSVRTPRMNAIAERWIGGCRRELLDRTLIWNHSHLRRIPGQYENTTTSTGRTAPARHGAAPRRAADTATRAGRPRPVPRPKTRSRHWPDQRISPDRMTWTRFSARTGHARVV